MADAGRILIMPKGTYDASVSYEMLDLVSYNDVAWLAKKPCVGIEPSAENSEYWFELLATNATRFGGETAEEWLAKIDAKTVSYGTSTEALGTSSAGSATTVSRSDHVHPLPALTSCTGTLTVAKGGTGITSNPSMLTNLGSTTEASVFATSPRPGVTGTLPVANGGTGATTLTSGRALIGAGTGAVTTRAITNSTKTTTAITASTNLVTMNTLSYALNRTTGLGTADKNYDTCMMRGISAGTTDMTAGSSTLLSGAIHIVYE